MIKQINELDWHCILKTFTPEVDLTRKNEGQALILTRPLVEDGVYTSEEQKRIYRRLVYMIKANGYEVIIKPHPRDKMDYK